VFFRWETRVWRHSASVQASNGLVFRARLVTLLPVFSTPSKLYRAIERAGKASEGAFAGGGGGSAMNFQVLTMVPVAPANWPVPPLTSKVVCPVATPAVGSKHP